MSFPVVPVGLCPRQNLLAHSIMRDQSLRLLLGDKKTVSVEGKTDPLCPDTPVVVLVVIPPVLLTTTTLAVASLPFFTAKEHSLKETYFRPKRFQLSSLGKTRAEGQETPLRFSSAPYMKMFIFRLLLLVSA